MLQRGTSITHAGAGALHNCAHIEKTTAVCRTCVGKRGTAITARGYRTKPRKNSIIHTQVWKNALLKHLLERKMHITSYKEHFFSKLLSNTICLDRLLNIINRTCHTCQWGQKMLFWPKLSLHIPKRNLMLGIMHSWTRGLSACMSKCCHHIHTQGSGRRWELEPIPASYSQGPEK